LLGRARCHARATDCDVRLGATRRFLRRPANPRQASTLGARQPAVARSPLRRQGDDDRATMPRCKPAVGGRTAARKPRGRAGPRQKSLERDAGGKPATAFPHPASRAPSVQIESDLRSRILIEHDLFRATGGHLHGSCSRAFCLQVESPEGKMLQSHKHRASFARKTAHTFAHDALEFVTLFLHLGAHTGHHVG
jgi:hypothetical protein